MIFFFKVSRGLLDLSVPYLRVFKHHSHLRKLFLRHFTESSHQAYGIGRYYYRIFQLRKVRHKITRSAGDRAWTFNPRLIPQLHGWVPFLPRPWPFLVAPPLWPIWSTSPRWRVLGEQPVLSPTTPPSRLREGRACSFTVRSSNERPHADC